MFLATILPCVPHSPMLCMLDSAAPPEGYAPLQLSAFYFNCLLSTSSCNRSFSIAYQHSDCYRAFSMAEAGLLDSSSRSEEKIPAHEDSLHYSDYHDASGTQRYNTSPRIVLSNRGSSPANHDNDE